MNNNNLKTENFSAPLSAVRMAQWTVDKMVSYTAVLLQGLIYSQNLLPEQLEHLCAIQRYEQMAYSKIRNISELCSDEAEPISTLKLASYNAEHYLSAVTAHIRKLVSNHNVEISSFCDSSCKSVILDLRRTSLVVYNLVSNSIIHNRLKQKVINIRAFMRGGDFVISVWDNGRGIPPSVRRTMFSAYENIPALKSGTAINPLILSGLGLSVCKKAAHDMSGDVFYVSSKTGGTEFELIIPQTNRTGAFGDTTIAEPDLQELEICLSGALLHLYKEI